MASDAQEKPLILVAHSRDGVGGSIITGADLAEVLEEGPWRIVSLCNSAGPCLDHHQARGLAAMSVSDATGLSYRPHPKDGNRLRRIGKRLFLIRAAMRLAREQRPALVHAHDESSALAWGLAGRRYGFPVLWHVHQHLPQKWTDPSLVRLSTHMLFIAEANRSRFTGKRIPPSTLIPNAVDLTRFSPDGAPAFPHEGPTVGFINNLVARKRPDWIVRAVGALRREGLPARLLIAGDDFSGGKDANDLARLAEQEGLGDAYRYLGPRSDVPALLRSVDVVALSSMAGREGAPRILVEAAASGVPVVATDVAGVGAIVVNGETGLLVPPDDYDAFVAALRDLLTDHARRDAMGQAAVAHARAHFSRAASATKLAALYTRLLAGER